MSLIRKGLLFSLLLGLSSLSLANHVRNQGATVLINQVPVLTFKTGFKGAGPAVRAEKAVDNFQNHLGSGSLTVKKVGKKEHRIVSGTSTLVIVSQPEAASHGTSTAGLASAWLRNIKSALSLPPLKLSDTAFKLPPEASRSVRLVGSRAAFAEVDSSDEQVVKVRRTSSGLDLTTVGPGTASVTVTAGSAIQTISVKVLPFAANFPQTMSATVTGIPATEETVRGAVEGAIRSQFEAPPGTEISFSTSSVGQVPIGETRTFSVKVSAKGPESYPKTGLVNVTVKNLAIARRPESALWYCNDPENVKKPQNLFASHLTADEPVRFLYHHINDSSQPLYIRIQVINESDKPARILLIPGDSQPDRNPVLAGLVAADQFVRNWMNGSGEVVTIPAKSTIPLSLRRLAPQQTMSGLCGVRLLDEGPESVFIRADAIPPFELDERWAAALDSSTPWREVGTPKISFYDTAPSNPSKHIFPNPFREEEVKYEVGGRYGFVRIGQKPIKGTDPTRALDGNFGVVYTIKAQVENPTAMAADVELVFEASAGYSGALFIVNGLYKRVPLMQAKSESQIARFRLEPGASKDLTIMTVPLSGSSYPATLTLRPVQELATGMRLEKKS